MLAALLLALAGGGLFGALHSLSRLPDAEPSLSGVPTCQGGLALQHLALQPPETGELLADHSGARLNNPGLMRIDVCRSGRLTLSLSGVGGGGWAAQAYISVDGRVHAFEASTVPQQLAFTITKPTILSVGLVNAAQKLAMRSLLIDLRTGPWCDDKPPTRTQGAWIQPGGLHGDIGAGGQIAFTACRTGEAQFTLSGQTDDGVPPQAEVKVGDRIIMRQPVLKSTLLKTVVRQGERLTFTVTNPRYSEVYRRTLSVEHLALR